MCPRFGEKQCLLPLLYMYSAPPCVYKRGRRALPSPSSLLALSSTLPQHTHTRYPEHDIGTCLNHLAETWEFPSLSRLACTIYYRHHRCKIVQCIRTPYCWTYGPTAGTRINRCVPVLPLASTIWSVGSRSILLVGAGPPGLDADTCRRSIYICRSVLISFTSTVSSNGS